MLGVQDTLRAADKLMREADNLESEIEKKERLILEKKRKRLELLREFQIYDDSHQLCVAIDTAEASRPGKRSGLITDEDLNSLLALISESLNNVINEKSCIQLMDALIRNEAAIQKLVKEHNYSAIEYNAEYNGWRGRTAFNMLGNTTTTQQTIDYLVDIFLLWGASELKASIQEIRLKILDNRRKRATLLSSIGKIFEKYDESKKLCNAINKAKKSKPDKESNLITDEDFNSILKKIKKSLKTIPDYVKSEENFINLMGELIKNEVDIQELTEKHKQDAIKFNYTYCVFSVTCSGAFYVQYADKYKSKNNSLVPEEIIDYCVDKDLIYGIQKKCKIKL